MTKKILGSNLSGHTYKLPGTPNLLIDFYTSESEFRTNVLSAYQDFKSKKQAKLPTDFKVLGIDAFSPPPKIEKGKIEQNLEDYITRQLAKLKAQNRLMTDQQLSDWRLGVKLTVGTRAKYIGPEREELAEDGLLVLRPAGQLGVITATSERFDGRRKIMEVTFRPFDPVEPRSGGKRVHVDLIVVEGTAGWLSIERVVD